MSQNSVAYEKYLKYKAKYLQLREELYGGGLSATEATQLANLFDEDKSGNITLAELVIPDHLSKNSTSYENIMKAYDIKLNKKTAGGVVVPIIEKFVRAVNKGKIFKTNDTTSKWNTGNKLTELVGTTDDFMTKLQGYTYQ